MNRNCDIDSHCEGCPNYSKPNCWFDDHYCGDGTCTENGSIALYMLMLTAGEKYPPMVAPDGLVDVTGLTPGPVSIICSPEFTPESQGTIIGEGGILLDILADKNVLDLSESEVQKSVVYFDDEKFTFKVTKRYIKFVRKYKVLLESEDMETWTECEEITNEEL